MRKNWDQMINGIVESEGLDGKIDRDMGEERKIGSFMISYTFFGGGDVSCQLSGGVLSFEGA